MKPIFIGGTGRCGTTILKKCLCQHDLIGGLRGELRLITDPDGVVDLYEIMLKTWTPIRADLALRRFAWLAYELTSHEEKLRYSAYALDRWTGEKEFADALWKVIQFFLPDLPNRDRLGGTLPYRGYRWTGYLSAAPDSRSEETGNYLCRDWSDTELRRTLRDFVDTLYQTPHPEALYFVDDTPDNAVLKDRIAEIFEDAFFIDIIRHPYDVLASWCGGHVPWTSNDAVLNARQIRELFIRSEAARMRLESTKSRAIYYQIRFEDLMAHPQRALAGILDCVGLFRGPSLSPLNELVEPLDSDKAHIGKWETADCGGVLGEKSWNEALDILKPFVEEYYG